MQYYRCKCGNAKAWTSMGVPGCVRCSKCGSDLAQSPQGHSDKPDEHDFVTKYDQNTGEPYDVCRRCMARRDELAALSQPAPKEPAAPRCRRRWSG